MSIKAIEYVSIILIRLTVLYNKVVMFSVCVINQITANLNKKMRFIAIFFLNLIK